MAETIAICAGCGAARKTKLTPKGKPRVPMKWKELRGTLYCPKCKDNLYRLRAVTFPVATVDGEWKDFCAAVSASLNASTTLANWAMLELLKGDQTRLPGMAKLPPLPPDKKGGLYLYGLLGRYPGRADWNGCASSAQALLKWVRSGYSTRRFEAIWCSRANLMHYRHGVPFPVPAQSWTPEYAEVEDAAGHKRKTPAVSVQLGGRRWTIHLAGSPKRWRQLQAFAALVSGEAVKGELAVYRRRSSDGSHRRTASTKAAGGGNRTPSRIMVKLVAYLPRREGKGAKCGSLEVRTARNSLLVAVSAGREKPWMLHADQMRRQVRAYERQRQRISDDTKAERRRPARERRGMNERLSMLAHRQRDNMRTFLHTTARMLVTEALRARASEIVYDDSDQRYVSPFPWAELRGLIQDKAQGLGIGFRHQAASVEVVEPQDSPEASEESSAE